MYASPNAKQQQQEQEQHTPPAASVPLAAAAAYPTHKPQEPVPFPGIKLLVGTYQKIWTKATADQQGKAQLVDALVSPTTGHAFIKIRDMHPSHSKPLYLCTELAMEKEGRTYVPTARAQVVVKASRLGTREAERALDGQPQLPKRRGGDEPLEEVKAMRHLAQGGPNVVPLLDSFVDEDHWLYLVQPYYGQGDLVEVLARRAAVPAARGRHEAWARAVFLQLISALTLLQQRGVAHLDVSPENCFVQEDGCSVALGDFGMALYVGSGPAPQDARPPPVTAAGEVLPPATPPKAPNAAPAGPRFSSGGLSVLLTAQRFRGKTAYSAPEALAEQPFNPHLVDCFALGCTLFALLTGRLFLEPSSAKRGPRPRFDALLKGDFTLLFDLDEHAMHLPPLARELIEGMVQPDPRARLSLGEVAAHPWVHGGPDVYTTCR